MSDGVRKIRSAQTHAVHQGGQQERVLAVRASRILDQAGIALRALGGHAAAQLGEGLREHHPVRWRSDLWFGGPLVMEQRHRAQSA